MQQLELWPVVQNGLGNHTSVVLNRTYCVGKSLDPSPRLVDAFNAMALKFPGLPYFRA